MFRFWPKYLFGRLGVLVSVLLLFLAIVIFVFVRGQFVEIFDRGARDLPPLQMDRAIAALENANDKTPEEVIAGLSHPLRVWRLQDAPASDPSDIRLPDVEAASRESLDRLNISVEELMVHYRVAPRPARPPADERPGVPRPAGPDLVELKDANSNIGAMMPEIVELETDYTRFNFRIYVHSYRLPDMEDKWINIYAHVITPSLEFMTPSFFLAVVVILAGVVLAGLVAARTMRPFNIMAHSADRFGRGEAIEPIPVTGPADVRTVVEAFNRMSLKLEQGRRSQRNLVYSLGHDIKGPAVWAMESAQNLPESEEKEQIKRQLDKLTRMVGAITSLAEQSQTTGGFVNADIGSLLEVLVDDFADADKDVRYTENAIVTLKCRPSDLERVFQNLIENALRYAGSAHVILNKPSQHQVEILVEDNGPGIPQDLLDTVKEPFRRGLDDANGTGLGLAIAETILVELSGKLELENRDEGGLRARVILPL